jgi:hypothetical protein
MVSTDHDHAVVVYPGLFERIKIGGHHFNGRNSLGVIAHMVLRKRGIKCEIFLQHKRRMNSIEPDQFEIVLFVIHPYGFRQPLEELLVLIHHVHELGAEQEAIQTLLQKLWGDSKKGISKSGTDAPQRISQCRVTIVVQKRGIAKNPAIQLHAPPHSFQSARHGMLSVRSLDK